MIREEDGIIKLADDCEAKICYIVGDAKTVDNIDKIIHDIADCTLTAEEIFELSKIFEKALKRLIIIPGDWHARLPGPEVWRHWWLEFFVVRSQATVTSLRERFIY